MKKYLPLLIILLSTGILFGQNDEKDILKKYDSYIVKHLETGKWWTEYRLKNGLITVEESYFKNELRSIREYEYDALRNRIREIRTFDINEGIINDTIEIKLIYSKDNLIVEKQILGTIEKYSDFNEFGKPGKLERIEEFGFSPYKEIFDFDENGNISKEIAYSEFKNTKDSLVREIESNSYKYDSKNNVIEIKREYNPKKTFPIPIAGGPSLYEIEKFRYVYNKNGLWIKKYKTVYGSEKLIAKRILK